MSSTFNCVYVELHSGKRRPKRKKNEFHLVHYAENTFQKPPALFCGQFYTSQRTHIQFIVQFTRQIGTILCGFVQCPMPKFTVVTHIQQARFSKPNPNENGEKK